jgi:hypothetical protein
MISRIDPASLSRDQINHLGSAYDLALSRNRRVSHATRDDASYKHALVDFMKNRTWHWFITIPIGRCEDDDSMVRRVRMIEAILCGRYLTKRYHKLPDTMRFSMLVVFEGERRNGDRHAHILAYLPKSTKRKTSHEMLMSLFPQEFRFLWHKLEPPTIERYRLSNKVGSDPLKERYRSSSKVGGIPLKESEIEWQFGKAAIRFECITPNRATYTIKHVRLSDVPWSRFEFATPPRFKAFNNKNLSVIRNRNRQRRRQVGLH